ncbi:hypothetical protein Tco_0567600 [Tanacetum coccineum]
MVEVTLGTSRFGYFEECLPTSSCFQPSVNPPFHQSSCISMASCIGNTVTPAMLASLGIVGFWSIFPFFKSRPTSCAYATSLSHCPSSEFHHVRAFPNRVQWQTSLILHWWQLLMRNTVSILSTLGQVDTFFCNPEEYGLTFHKSLIGALRNSAFIPHAPVPEYGYRRHYPCCSTSLKTALTTLIDHGL